MFILTFLFLSVAVCCDLLVCYIVLVCVCGCRSVCVRVCVTMALHLACLIYLIVGQLII